MPNIKSTYTYESKSQNNDGLWFLDHDSEMTMMLVEQLVLDSKSLLVGKTFDDTDVLERPFNKLYNVLISLNDTLTITKGIHQRISDPHITFLITGDNLNAEYEFHLQLSADPINRSYVDGSTSIRFTWKPCKLSVFVYTGSGPRQYTSYPVGEVSRTTGRSRGFSITENQIESHVEARNKSISTELEKERLRKEEEERLKQIAAEELKQRIAKTEDNFPTLLGSPKPVGGPKQVGPTPKGKTKFKPLNF